jgi:predicted nucleic acid-binding Zn ribbon protein
MKKFRLSKAPEIKYFESAEYYLKIKKARHRMRAKPFTERFKNIETLAKIGTLIFPAVSILTAITFLYSYIYESTGWFFFSIAVSFILLAFVELSKNNLINNGLDTYFSNSGKSTIVFIFAGLFSIASFIMSYNGAEMLVHKLDKSKQTISGTITAKQQSIDQNYDKLIAAEKEKIAAINKKAKNQWHGMLTPEQSKRVEIYETNIQKYTDLREKYKDRLLNEKQNKLSNAATKTYYNAWVFKIIAAINEFLTILSIAFLVFYDFKTVQQDIFLNKFRQNPNKYKAIERKKSFLPISDNQENMPLPDTKPLSDVSLNTALERTEIKGFLRGNDLMHGNRFTLNVQPTRKCKHCGAEFTYKHWNKQYCSDECRISHWEQTTGKTFRIKNNSQIPVIRGLKTK